MFKKETWFKARIQSWWLIIYKVSFKTYVAGPLKGETIWHFFPNGEILSARLYDVGLHRGVVTTSH